MTGSASTTSSRKAATRPLVFVHGWCCDHTFFRPQFDHFKATHTVVTLDLRGCGERDRPEDGYEPTSYADDVAFLCRELGLSRPVVVGHSLGGMIGIELAARHPSVPGAIVAADPGPIDTLPETQLAYDSVIAAMGGPDGEAARRAFVDGNFLPSADPDLRRSIVETMTSVPLPLATITLRGVLDWNGVGALRGCAAPLLVLLSATGGSNDPPRLLAHKANAHIGVTVGSGHFHQLEVPEQVTPMIERFLTVAL